MNNPPERAWRLRLYGGFCLRNPRGEEVRLADRKVEGLLAILTLFRERGIERRVAADLLWPDKGADNLTNLRQAILNLRRAIGADAIESSRNHCRLSASFPLTGDFERGASREGVFLPEHEGAWFDEVRMGRNPSTTGPQSAVDHFYQTLKWFSENDRRGMHSLLASRTSLTRGIACNDLLQLLQAGPDHESCLGWAR